MTEVAADPTELYVIVIAAVVGAAGGALSRLSVHRYQYNAAPTGNEKAAQSSHERSRLAAGTFEALGALLCGLLAMRYQVPESLAYWWLALVGLALGYLDWTTQRLPNALCLAAYLGVGGCLAATAVVNRDGNAALRAAIGGMLLATFLLVIAMASRGGMGMGDVKLAATVGTALSWSGWSTLITGTLTALLLGALIGGLGIVLRQLKPHQHFAFGPHLLAATMITLLVNP